MDVFLNISDMENNLPNDVKMSLVYVAGYVVRKDTENFDDTKFYVQSFGKYTDELNRGGLTLPGDNVCQWVFFHTYFFMKSLILSAEQVCAMHL